VIELSTFHAIAVRKPRTTRGLPTLFASLLLIAAACGSKQPVNEPGGQGGNRGIGGDNRSGAGTGGAAGSNGAAGSAPTGAGGRGAGGMGVGGMGVGGHVGVGGAMAACQAPIAITAGTAATVTANLGALGATVSPDLMGVHTSVYDGNMQLGTTIWRLRDAGIKSLRYPGGSYADLYHWELHTGTHTPASGLGSNTITIAAGTDFGSFIRFMENAQANAMITVNYGVNSTGTGPGRPQEAAAWVAYANGSPTNTRAIGVDADGHDWMTVGYWASLRAAAPLPTDDGQNFLRISHPTPVGIKYWEIGNEVYGNGFYYTGCGWEPDLHVPYPPDPTTDPMCAGVPNAAFKRLQIVALSPKTYGSGVVAFAGAMKAVDPTIKIGGIVNWPSSQYSDWNSAVLGAAPDGAHACPSMDFAVAHWYAGRTLTGLLSIAETDIKPMFASTGGGLRQTLSLSTYNCPASMPIAVTEWGANMLPNLVTLPPSTINAAPAGSQIVGLFAAESYANFMEQGALSVHWLELHNNSYLAGVDAMNPAADPFTVENDSPRWGYHGQLIAHYLASGNDRMATATVSNAGALQTLLKTHAAVHADGSVSVMITNTSATTAANVNVAITGGATALACVGIRHVYAPVNGDEDGDVTSSYIFSAADGLSVPVAVPPYSTVVVAFPKR
jgi:hypothetical protein